jgi:hypothetical protein
MLNPDQLLVLGRALVAPPGYEVDALIATTYTLDVPMALALPLSFLRQAEFAGQDADSVSPIEVFEALRRLVPRYRVFCDSDGMHALPRRHMRLLPLLDTVIVPVTVPSTAARPGGTFHPKLIVARYTCEEQPAKMRAICMSRNLTADPFMDISVTLDGDEQTRGQEEHNNSHLAAALELLPTWTRRSTARGNTRALIRSVAQAVRRTTWHAPDGFSKCTFMPMGFASNALRDPTLPQEGENRALVVSPFLGAARLERLSAPSETNVLLSRRDALYAVGTRALERFDRLFVIAAQIEIELHAKLYVLESPDESRWLVGSANATESAVKRNAEILVELSGATPALRIDSLIGRKTGFGELLEEHETAPEDNPDPDEDSPSELDKALRDLTSRAFKGSVTEAHDGTYTMTVSTERRPLALDLVVLCRLAGTRSTPVPLDLLKDPAAQLTGLKRSEISPFLVLEAQPDKNEPSRESTVLLDVDGIDLMQLGHDALRDAIGNPVAYIGYLIAGADAGVDLSLTFGDEDPAQSAEAAGRAHERDAVPKPFLEKLLRLLHAERNAPVGRLDRIEQAFAMFRDDLTKEEPELVQLWDTLERARK